MKLMRTEERCAHGFLRGRGLCEECEGNNTQTRNEAKVTRTEVLVPGRVVAGVTILRRLSNGDVEVRCACGEAYATQRGTLYQARQRGGQGRCPKCRPNKQQKKGAAA